MHCKPPALKAVQHMASVSGCGGGDDDGDGSRSGKSISLGQASPRSCALSNNNDNTSHTNSNPDESEIQLKKQTLEQRKQELEKLLSEKSWLLQQLQKQEAHLLNGNYEYLNLNEIFGTAPQSKFDASLGNEILRRKSVGASAKENHNKGNNNNNSNRHSEVSNRSSEYDNYPGEQSQGTTQQLPVLTGILKVAPKKRQPASSVSSWNAPNTRPQAQQQQPPPQLLRQQFVAQMTEQEHFQYTQQQVLQHQQQQRQLLQHQHYHPRQQLITAYHTPSLTTQAIDGVSLYSASSAHVPPPRPPHSQPPHVAAHLQTPIVVQCDKYYLSPTHQSFGDGGFIKSSQNIKQYISPLASPTASGSTAAAVGHKLGYEQPLSMKQKLVVSSRSFDTISMSPSFAGGMEAQSHTKSSVDSGNSSNLRWRSQCNIQYSVSSSAESKTHSSDRLPSGNPHSPSNSGHFYAAAALKCKPLDEISVASYNSETQKKSKPKQWLESSLDGPVVRTNANNSPVNMQQPPRPSQAKPQAHILQRERPRLSSQSMCSGAQRYNSVTQRGTATRLLQDDDGKYTKLSQSTSYLNSIDALAVNTYFPEVAVAGAASASPVPPPKETTFHYIPPKIATRPLALPAAGVAAIGVVEKAAHSPEIRIESPKNMTVVQQATFQPYKEITKPFEMSDFYKYSTKFKQKEVPTATAGKMSSQGET